MMEGGGLKVGLMSSKPAIERCHILIASEPRGSELKHALNMLQPQSKNVTAGGVHNAFFVSLDSSQSVPAWPDRVLKLVAECGQEGFAVAPAGSAHLAVAAPGEKGLANGLYELRRILLSSSGIRAPDFTNAMRQGIHKPAFPHRDSYHFLSPWRLQHLSMDTFSFDEWVAHLEFLRSLNVNRVYIDIWTNQYYHPKFPATCENKPLWERLHKVMAYAREIGLRTGLYVFPCQVPVCQWLEHPEGRAVEAANYYGIEMCWTRAKADIIPFDRFLLEYFDDVVNDLVIELEDPGVCLCESCCDHFAEMTLNIVETYRDWWSVGADRKVDLCTLHFRDWIEQPDEFYRKVVGHPVPNLRADVFKKLPKDTTIIDMDRSTLDMARDYGLQTGYFFFDLDPESGMEDMQVFPRVHLERIESQISDSVARGDVVIQDYRMMPQSQFVADYVLFRKCWDSSAPVKKLLLELGGTLGLDESRRHIFSDAMLGLERWWCKADLESLEDARDKLACVSPAGEPLTDLADLTDVLAIMGRYLITNRDRVCEENFYPERELVNKVYERIKDSRIFQAYTTHQHWVNRSLEVIGQRLRWWLQGIDKELPKKGKP